MSLVESMFAGSPLSTRVSTDSAARNDGPVDYYLSCGIKQTDGMTLRDYFAGQALVGRMSHRFANTSDLAVHARAAYLAADAMLAERSK